MPRPKRIAEHGLKRIIAEQGLSELASITTGVLAGLILAALRGKLMEVGGLMILIPSFIQLNGAVASTLSARLGTGLHTGVVKPSYKIDEEKWQNIIGAFSLGILGSIIIGLFTYTSCLIFMLPNAGIIKLILIPLIASIFSSLIMTLTTLHPCILLFKKGYDPDNIMGPYVTSVGDFIGIPCLFLAVYIVGAM